MSLKRRTILQMVPAVAAASMVPVVKSQAPHRVVVIGGGFAGATVAKYIRMWSDGAIEVTLVEPRLKHVSCIMSNLVLNRQLTIPDLSFDYATLQGKYGITVIQDRVQRISDAGPEIELKDSGWIPYDSLVVAAGIQFDAVPGLEDRLATPHAWKAGGQTVALRNQIEAMPPGGTFVMSIPDKPYRCPPGPYERACLVADLVRDRGGKVVVLDANDGIQAEREKFTRAFNQLYAGIVDYRPLERVEAIDQGSNTVYTKRLDSSGGEIGDGMAQGDVVNIIPRHGAPWLLRQCGLTGGGRWAPVDPTTYGSSLEQFPNVYVIGDSQATGQPKSGHMANAQAKVCADAIVRRAAQMPVDSPERLANITTNSACFSPINANEASWLTAVFAYDPETRKMGLVPGSLGEAHEWNSENYRDMFSWSKNLFSDTFM